MQTQISRDVFSSHVETALLVCVCSCPCPPLKTVYCWTEDRRWDVFSTVTLMNRSPVDNSTGNSSCGTYRWPVAIRAVSPVSDLNCLSPFLSSVFFPFGLWWAGVGGRLGYVIFTGWTWGGRKAEEINACRCFITWHIEQRTCTFLNNGVDIKQLFSNVQAKCILSFNSVNLSDDEGGGGGGADDDEAVSSVSAQQLWCLKKKRNLLLALSPFVWAELMVERK